MKRYIHASEDGTFTNADLVKLLQDRGIDTTKSKYALKYQFFDRFGEDEAYVCKFTCPGDYLAYFSLRLSAISPSWRIPNAENIEEAFGVDRFIETLDKYPTLDAIAKVATDKWAWKEEFNDIYLKNLTTGATLYEGEMDSYDEFEEDWED